VARSRFLAGRPIRGFVEPERPMLFLACSVIATVVFHEKTKQVDYSTHSRTVCSHWISER
jgi:hypothetical protein